MDQATSTMASADAISGNEMTRAKAGLHEQRTTAQAMPRTEQPLALFARLPDDLLTRLFAKAKTLDLPAKAELFSAGAPGDECYRVQKGSLKVSVISKNGTERTLSIVGANSVLGELSMLDGRPRSATVTALTDCRLKYITRAEFQRFAAEVPTIYEHLTKLLAGMVRHTDNSIAAGAFLSNEGRLAWAFLQLAQEFGNGGTGEGVVIRLMLSQADIGSLAGISREHASRILNKWMRQGILARVNRYYTILATERLEHIAQM
jgi:CRP-like cAMP-binding protein